MAATYSCAMQDLRELHLSMRGVWDRTKDPLVISLRLTRFCACHQARISSGTLRRLSPEGPIREIRLKPEHRIIRVPVDFDLQ
jgi:hypothetical protein